MTDVDTMESQSREIRELRAALSRVTEERDRMREALTAIRAMCEQVEFESSGMALADAIDVIVDDALEPKP